MMQQSLVQRVFISIFFVDEAFVLYRSFAVKCDFLLSIVKLGLKVKNVLLLVFDKLLVVQMGENAKIWLSDLCFS